jgi:acylphosphatase
MRHVVIHVLGDVQGVAFRANVQREALRLRLAGTVRNEPDGSVTVQAEGSEPAVEQLVAWCRHGPATARVERVEITDGKWQGLKGFEIEAQSRSK